MHPLYFGTSKHRLFAIYHAAGRTTSGAAAGGVVMCYPTGHEYIRSYRAFRSLAIGLAEAGFHVLRFDYFGTGDSAGESAERSIRQCIIDVGTAVDELKDMVDLRRVSLIGLRFGALLAAHAAAERDDIERLVLWDPVTDGRKYLDRLRLVQEGWFRTRPGPKGAAARELKNELLGYPFPEALAAEFESTDLRSIAKWPVRRVDVVASEEGADSIDCRQYVAKLPVPGSYRHVPTNADWDSPSSVHRALLAHAIVQEILSIFGDEQAERPREPAVYKVTQPPIESVRDTVVKLWEKNLRSTDRPQRHEWYYLANPAGHGTTFLISAVNNGSGEVVGCTGVSPRLFYVNGRPLRALLSADFAVDKAHRTVKPAIMLQRAAREFGQTTGDFSYGFPNASAVGVFARIGYRRLGTVGRYAKVLRHRPYLRRAGWVSAPATVAARVLDGAAALRDYVRGPRGGAMRKLEWLRTFDDRFDRLWEEGQSRYRILGNRSSEWLRWRFAPESGTRCEIAALIDPRTNQICAYAVVAPKEEGIARIGDFFGATPRDVTLLMSFLARHLRRRQYRSISVYFLGTRWVSEVLESQGFVLRDADRSMVLDPGSRIDVETFLNPDNWYLTAADTDT
jgi:pimeloyl-ACP methyl ester carboxylesterase